MLLLGLSPRVRGNRLPRSSRRGIIGLSPRVRGNQTNPTAPPPRRRSIPACAGEPAAMLDNADRVSVYPRVCGGTSRVRRRICPRMGLSPRVRGNPTRGGGGSGVGRSIPACAGEPATRRRVRNFPKVYPRVCGGTTANTTGRAAPWGLSPRVRGNRPRPGVPGRGQGSIPACAGEPGFRSRRPKREQVYPRVCGGTLVMSAAALARWGLSPRVRGNHILRGTDAAVKWSIPACAGEPHRMR